MDKEYIVKEIDRTAKENNDVPLGRYRFEKDTGIKYSDWYGKHWAKWGDALIEAGYAPNQKQHPFDETFLIEKVVSLIREIRKFPAEGEFRLKAHKSKDFPETTTIHRRLGNKHALVARILAYCEGKPEYSDVLAICQDAASSEEKFDSTSKESDVEYGYVYLMKFQRLYKIGSSNNVERRNYELGTKLPEDLKMLHKIRTDDPFGIEAYWHNRFKDKKARGEYFALSSEDIVAFRRRKFM